MQSKGYPNGVEILVLTPDRGINSDGLVGGHGTTRTDGTGHQRVFTTTK